MTDQFQHTAYICVGSNIGDKLLNCQKGIAGLTGNGQCVLEQSPFYMTEPVDYEDQDWFINAVIKIGTALDPFQLLDLLKSVEKNAGRCSREKIRFGPRMLDLDIILYDNTVMNTDRLTIPHPRMHERRFVLQPLCDIDFSIIHPVFRREMQYLLNHLTPGEQKVVQYR